MKKTLISALITATLCGAGFAQNSTEIKKVDMVLSMMSARAQKEIVIADKKQFVVELNKVLADEKNYATDDLELFFLIDKKHKAPDGYAPKTVPLVKNQIYGISRNDLSLRPDVEPHLVELSKAAAQDGIWIVASSTYRSYDYQAKLFQRWVDIDGLEEAERESARPGTSQHQLGSAIDFGSVTNDFINTKQGKWLYENGWRYGWSLSFPQGYEDITGYRYECWHYRYIGKPACELQRKYFNNVQQYLLEFIDLWKKN